jgi:hypothetical protein
MTEVLAPDIYIYIYRARGVLWFPPVVTPDKLGMDPRLDLTEPSVSFCADVQVIHDMKLTSSTESRL